MAKAALQGHEAKYGRDMPATYLARENVAQAVRAAGRTAEAIALSEATMKMLQRSRFGRDPITTAGPRIQLALAYQAAGRLTDALPLFEDTLKTYRDKYGTAHPITLSVTNELTSAYLDAKRWPEAEAIARQCLGFREARPGHWRRSQTMSQLGAALAGQEKYTEAEPLLLRGYEGLEAHEAEIPAPHKTKLSEARARVAELYESWGKSEKAAEWRKRRGPASPELPADVFARPGAG
jgi:tetratricopeptide (TPR) repeat protein